MQSLVLHLHWIIFFVHCFWALKPEAITYLCIKGWQIRIYNLPKNLWLYDLKSKKYASRFKLCWFSIGDRSGEYLGDLIISNSYSSSLSSTPWFSISYNSLYVKQNIWFKARIMWSHGELGVVEVFSPCLDRKGKINCRPSCPPRVFRKHTIGPFHRCWLLVILLCLVSRWVSHRD